VALPVALPVVLPVALAVNLWIDCSYIFPYNAITAAIVIAL